MRAVVHDSTGHRRFSGSTRSSGRYPRRTRSSSGSTPRRSPGRDCGSAAPSRSSPRSSPGSPPSADPRHGAGRRGRGCRRGRHRVRGRRRGLRRHGYGRAAEFVCVRESGALAHKPAGTTFEEAAAICDGASIALACLSKAGLAAGAEHPRLRRLRIHGHRRGAAGQVLRCRVTPCATRRTSSSCARSEPTTSSTTRSEDFTEERRDLRRRSSTRSASTRSGAAGAR